MAKLYVEPFSGISGNMFMGALFDLGASFSKVKSELEKLNLGEYELVYEKVDKCGIHATHFDVILPDEQHHHHHEEHEHVHHEHHHEHSHAHEEHTHTHEKHGAEAHVHGNEIHEHHHEHVHEQHDHSHAHLSVQEQVHVHAHAHRNLADILGIINSSALSDHIKTKAAEVFTELGKAEAKVHGKSLDEIHFHEVGAIDTIIDIVGGLLALEDLGITEIYVGKLQTGQGFVRCAHGLMPIPAPATAELLKGIPYYQGELSKELVTPTGAALMHTLAKVSVEMPENFSGAVIGYGAGTWDLPIPNVVRLHLDRGNGAFDCGTVPDTTNRGTAALITPSTTSEELVVAECNLDDTTGEILGYTLDKLMTSGALDAWYTPIFMKKGRPAFKLSVLCKLVDLTALEHLIFTETSTLGIRTQVVSRTALERRFYTVEFLLGEVRLKAGYLDGLLVNVAPEYSDCVALAEAMSVPVKQIMAEALEKGKKIVAERL